MLFPNNATADDIINNYHNFLVYYNQSRNLYFDPFTGLILTNNNIDLDKFYVDNKYKYILEENQIYFKEYIDKILHNYSSDPDFCRNKPYKKTDEDILTYEEKGIDYCFSKGYDDEYINAVQINPYTGRPFNPDYIRNLYPEAEIQKFDCIDNDIKYSNETSSWIIDNIDEFDKNEQTLTKISPSVLDELAKNSHCGTITLYKKVEITMDNIEIMKDYILSDNNDLVDVNIKFEYFTVWSKTPPLVTENDDQYIIISNGFDKDDIFLNFDYLSSYTNKYINLDKNYNYVIKPGNYKVNVTTNESWRFLNKNYTKAYFDLKNLIDEQNEKNNFNLDYFTCNGKYIRYEISKNLLAIGIMDFTKNNIFLKNNKGYEFYYFDSEKELIDYLKSVIDFISTNNDFDKYFSLKTNEQISNIFLNFKKNKKTVIVNNVPFKKSEIKNVLIHMIKNSIETLKKYNINMENITIKNIDYKIYDDNKKKYLEEVRNLLNNENNDMFNYEENGIFKNHGIMRSVFNYMKYYDFLFDKNDLYISYFFEMYMFFSSTLVIDGYYNYRILNYKNENVLYNDLLNRFINITQIHDHFLEINFDDDNILNVIVGKIKSYYEDILRNLDKITSNNDYTISDFLSTFYSIIERNADYNEMLNISEYKEKYPLITNGEYTYGKPTCFVYGDLTNIKYNNCVTSESCNLNCYNSNGTCNNILIDLKKCITNTIEKIDYDKKLGFLISIKDYKKFDIQDISNIKKEQYNAIFLNKIQYNLGTTYYDWQISDIIFYNKMTKSTYNDYFKIILSGVFNFLNLETIYHMALNKKNNSNIFQNEPYEFLTAIFTNIKGRDEKYISQNINPDKFIFDENNVNLKINDEEKSFIDDNGINIEIINDFETKTSINKEIQNIKDVFSILENEQNRKNYKKYYDLMNSLNIGNDEIEKSDEEKFYENQTNNIRKNFEMIVRSDWIVHEIVIDDYLINISKKKLASLFQTKILKIFQYILSGEYNIYDYPVFINSSKKSSYFNMEFLILLKILGYEKWYCYAILE